jgi:hypothetical protein
MNYPIQIDYKPQLMRMIREIARGSHELQREKKQPLMSKQDDYKTPGVERVLIDRAIAKGSLKLHCIQGKKMLLGPIIFRSIYYTVSVYRIL